MINSSLTQFFFVFKFFVSKCQNLLRVLVFFSSFVFSLSHSAFNVLILCLALQSNRFGPTIFFLLGSALAWCTHTWFYWLNWIFLPLLLFSVVDGSRTLLVSLCFFLDICIHLLFSHFEWAIRSEVEAYFVSTHVYEYVCIVWMNVYAYGTFGTNERVYPTVCVCVCMTCHLSASLRVQLRSQTALLLLWYCCVVCSFVQCL